MEVIPDSAYIQHMSNEIARITSLLAKMNDETLLIEANSVPVVRCRDCVRDKTNSCPLCWIDENTPKFVRRDPDFFCSEGKRKGAAG